MCSNFIGNHAGFYVVAVGQAQMLLRGDVAQHGAAEPADHRRADAAGDVVIARCDVCGQGAECVERGFVAFFQLFFHVP